MEALCKALILVFMALLMVVLLIISLSYAETAKVVCQVGQHEFVYGTLTEEEQKSINQFPGPTWITVTLPDGSVVKINSTCVITYKK